MGPRKKARPNDEARATEEQAGPGPSTPNTDDTPQAPDATSQNPDAPQIASSPSSTSAPVEIPRNKVLLENRTPSGSAGNRGSWYGSWKGKAKPIAELARDNVPASPMQASTSRPGSVSERRSAQGAPSPRRYMSSSHRPQSKSNILQASVSNVSVTSSGSKDPKTEEPARAMESKKEPVPDPPLPPDPVVEQKPDDTHDSNAQEQPKEPQKEQQRPASGGWFGWWSRPDGYEEKSNTEGLKDSKEAVAVVEEAQQKPLPGISPVEERTQPKVPEVAPPPPATEPPAKEPPTTEPPAATQDPALDKPTNVSTGSQSRSWFGLWSTQQNAQVEQPPKETNQPQQAPPEAPIPPPEANVPVPPAVIPSESAPSSDTAANDPPKENTKSLPKKKSTGWAFWSREEPDTIDSGFVHKQVGELAVADTPSQTHPEAAQFNEQEEQPPKEPLRSKAGSIRGRARGKGKETPSISSTPAASTPATSTPIKTTPSGSPTRKLAEPANAAKPATPEATKDKNLLLPEFRNTYSYINQPTIWAQIRQYFLGDPDANVPPHLHITPNPPKIKKAIAIGIHGFFPSPIFQKVLGQPTGTSIRFSNCAAQAIKNWTEARGYDCEIEKIALEGEGFITDRVDTLWKLLLNWIEQIRQADFILVASHSQGVPVAIMLVAKLIAFGCVPHSRIGVCAMAGVNLGPFVEYKTRIFGGSALELFDFSNPNSKVSQMYQGALQEVLRFGVRIVYVGSIDDQLVSLESSTFSTLTHPLVYRAVFIDGRLHTSDFLSNLVGFVLKLRNLGLPDHGLIRELSPAIAGALFTGEGHSSLHHYVPIYDLAVKHALETTNLDKAIEPEIRTYEGPPGAKEANPFFLPWAMRGILEEEVVRREMGDEIQELLRMFEEWRPISKGLKDVKFRLEAVRSKL